MLNMDFNPWLLLKVRELLPHLSFICYPLKNPISAALMVDMENYVHTKWIAPFIRGRIPRLLDTWDKANNMCWNFMVAVTKEQDINEIWPSSREFRRCVLPRDCERKDTNMDIPWFFISNVMTQSQQKEPNKFGLVSFGLKPVNIRANEIAC